ncbi:PepSY-associated TM helix domain-containing protein [Falsiroseomonas ponticola]|uniref:PepSY-associated TM helix domain-containing protein n=1 Tax=Falsiroseomonas ponticola TaxID=2786951 RepID=UPI0019329D5C|nr:PepSY-associated TM helix domain-containing protein [Roseomonas ponticola]
MSKVLFLKLHRWVALVFALPLLAVILSGLVLSVEPALKATTPDGTVTLERLERIIEAAGPAGRGGALAIQGYAGTASLGGRGASTTYDLATAVPVQPTALPGLFRTMRGLHERLLLDLGWLVVASTIALVALGLAGLLLGWPRLRNTLGGWHRVTGWALLPLLVGSPLTGLALAFGITFTTPAPVPPGATPPLLETLRQVAARHDLDGLDFIRPIGGGRLVRVLDERGTAIAYRAGPEGLVRQPDNWPRLLHEGGWGGLLGSALNLVTSVALVGLLGTGVFIWARRTLAKRRAKAARRLTASPAG